MKSPATLLLVATRNRHKLQEIRQILGPPFTCESLEGMPDAPVLVEDAATFDGNAARKAGQLAAWIAASPQRVPSWDRQQALGVLADDSGLEVDALNGAPGVHSARFARLETGTPGNASDAENNAKLLALLQDVPWAQRTARFRCVLALVQVVPPRDASAEPAVACADSSPRLFEGVCEGHLAFAPQGQNGFGYDPLFIPEGYTASFAELGEPTKNQLSHRARAVEALKRWLGAQDPA